MKSKSIFGGFIFVVLFGLGLVGAYAVYNPADRTGSIVFGAGSFLLALLVSAAIKIADPWAIFTASGGRAYSLSFPSWIRFPIGSTPG